MSEPRGIYATGRDWDQPLIRNCRFSFRCNQRWTGLEPTSDPRVRRCHDCERPVVLCEKDDQLREALLADECVAVPTGTGPEPRYLLGIPRLRDSHDT